MLADELWCGSASAAAHWQRQRRFGLSLAAASVAGYLLGIGDRHMDNMLLDLVRVDLDMARVDLVRVYLDLGLVCGGRSGESQHMDDMISDLVRVNGSVRVDLNQAQVDLEGVWWGQGTTNWCPSPSITRCHLSGLRRAGAH